MKLVLSVTEVRALARHHEVAFACLCTDDDGVCLGVEVEPRVPYGQHGLLTSALGHPDSILQPESLDEVLGRDLLCWER